MTQPKLKLNLKKVAQSELVENLSKHLSAYEDRWKKVLKEFDVKSRDAKERSKEQWEHFSKQVKGRRAELEKRVQTIFHKESQRLSKQINQGANDLFKYLKSVAKNEKLNAKAASSGGAKTQKGARASGGNASKSKKASAGKSGKRAKKSKGAGLSSVASAHGASSSLPH